MIAACALLSLPIALVVVSELGEVVIRSEIDGEEFATRIWVVNAPGGILVRGSSGKAWVEAARRAGRVTVERGEVRHHYAVRDRSNRAGIAEVNALMREKHRVADRVIGAMRDYEDIVVLYLEDAESD